MDINHVFCENQAIGVITHNDALSVLADAAVTNLLVATNIINLGGTNTDTREGGDVAEGNPLLLDIFCAVPHAGAGSLLFFQLMTCDTEGGTYTTLWTSKLFAVGELIADKNPVLTQMIPSGLRGSKQFLKLYFGAITADTSAGTFSAAIRPFR